MKTFQLGNNTITFSTEFDSLNQLRYRIIHSVEDDYVDTCLGNIAEDCSPSDMAEKFIKELPGMIDKSVCNTVPVAIDFLIENDIYDVDEESFIKKYFHNYFNFRKQPEFISLCNNYQVIVDAYDELREKKAEYRDNRSHWEGGGFGIQGAIKGAANAAVLNAATGAVRGVGDGISDAFSSVKYRRQRAKLIESFDFDSLNTAFFNCVLGVFLACQDLYAERLGIACPWCDKENNSKAISIYNNVQSRVQDPEKALKLIAEAIRNDPYKIIYYEYLFKKCYCDRKQVLDLAEYLGLSLQNVQEELFIDLWNSLDEKYLDDDGEIKNTDNSQTAVENYYAYEKEFLEMGKIAYLWETDPSIVINGNVNSSDIIEYLDYALYYHICGLDEEREILFEKDEYNEKSHNYFVDRIAQAKIKYNCEEYALPLTEYETREMIDFYLNGEDLKLARRVTVEKHVFGILDEIDAISLDGAIGCNEKIEKLKPYSAFASEGYNAKEDKEYIESEVQHAAIYAIAAQKIISRFGPSLDTQILNPSSAITSISSGIRTILLEAGILEEQNAKQFSSRLEPKPDHDDYQHFSAGYNQCLDAFNIANEIETYIQKRRLGENYLVINLIGQIITNEIADRKRLKTIQVNETLDPHFGKTHPNHNGKRTFIGSGFAQIGINEVLFLYYEKRTLLDSIFTGVTELGVYRYNASSEDTVLYRWEEINDAKDNTTNVKIKLKNGQEVSCEFGGGFDFSAPGILTSIINRIKKSKELQSAITPQETLHCDSKTFLSRRLAHYLNQEDKEKVLIGSVSDTSSITKDVLSCKEITNIESNPHVNLFLSSKPWEPGTPLTDAHGQFLLLLTNNYLYFPFNPIGRIPVSNIVGIRSEETGSINIYAKPDSYELSGIKNISNLDQLCSHINDAIVVQLCSAATEEDRSNNEHDDNEKQREDAGQSAPNIFTQTGSTANTDIATNNVDHENNHDENTRFESHPHCKPEEPSKAVQPEKVESEEELINRLRNLTRQAGTIWQSEEDEARKLEKLYDIAREAGIIDPDGHVIKSDRVWQQRTLRHCLMPVMANTKIKASFNGLLFNALVYKNHQQLIANYNTVLSIVKEFGLYVNDEDGKIGLDHEYDEKYREKESFGYYLSLLCNILNHYPVCQEGAIFRRVFSDDNPFGSIVSYAGEDVFSFDTYDNLLNTFLNPNERFMLFVSQKENLQKGLVLTDKRIIWSGVNGIETIAFENIIGISTQKRMLSSNILINGKTEISLFGMQNQDLFIKLLCEYIIALRKESVCSNRNTPPQSGSNTRACETVPTEQTEKQQNSDSTGNNTSGEITHNDLDKSIPLSELSDADLSAIVLSIMKRFGSDKCFAVGTSEYQAKIAKAMNAYASFTQAERPLLLEDQTIFGSAKEGIVLTDKALYCKPSFEKKAMVPVPLISTVYTERNDQVKLNTIYAQTSEGNKQSISIDSSEQRASCYASFLDYIIKALQANALTTIPEAKEIVMKHRANC